MMRVKQRLRCNHTSNHLHLFLLIILIGISPITLLADTTDEKKLAKLQQRIQKLQLELEQDNKKKDKAIHELKLTEQAISKTSERLHRLNKQFHTAQAKIKKLNQQQTSLKKQLSSNRYYLAKQIRAAYAMGKQEYVKLLLNQQDPSTVARMVVYYQYFNASRAERLQEIDSSLANLNNVRQQIDDKTSELSQLRQQAIEDKNTLSSKRKQRKQLVAKLSSKLQKKDHALKALIRDEQHLKRLLDQIEHELDKSELAVAVTKDFRQLKGQLPWPTKGRLTARFGSVRNSTGNLKWKGTVIQTQPGESIRAVAYGRVVFADWLRGFGMLLIIDHGKGFMSLYGHNEQLHKKLGDWVQANEIIATSGNSGGQDTTSLYFEIRHNGVPQNPKKWCKSLPHLS